MKQQRNCDVCGQPLPPNSNGNKKRHNKKDGKDCDKKAKQKNSKTRYAKVKKMDNEAIRLDKILESFYSPSKGSNYISKALLEDKKFNFSFITNITNPESPIFWLLNYGYEYSDDKKDKIIIHYGSNPL
jgi:hypothetical protein